MSTTTVRQDHDIIDAAAALSAAIAARAGESAAAAVHWARWSAACQAAMAWGTAPQASALLAHLSGSYERASETSGEPTSRRRAAREAARVEFGLD